MLRVAASVDVVKIDIKGWNGDLFDGPFAAIGARVLVTEWHIHRSSQGLAAHALAVQLFKRAGYGKTGYRTISRLGAQNERCWGWK